MANKFKRRAFKEISKKEEQTRIFIGIDVGKAGAIAAINSFQKIILLADCPSDEFQMAVLVSRLSGYDAKGAIERAQSMPSQGVKSMFTYGTNYGYWMGIFAANKIPFLLPTPQAWQKGVISKAEDKKPALAAAGRMFPGAELYGPKGGGKDGRADALLIADWCRRQNLQGLL